MNFSEPLISQYEKFFVFIGLGFLLGIFYELALFLRGLISNKKTAWIVQDIIFSIISTVLIYFMLLAYTNGEIRVILIFSTALGFVLFKLSFGKIIEALLKKLQKMIKTVVEVLFKPFRQISKLIEKQIEKSKESFCTMRSEIKKKRLEKVSAKKVRDDHKNKKIHKKLKKDLKNKQKSV